MSAKVVIWRAAEKEVNDWVHTGLQRGKSKHLKSVIVCLLWNATKTAAALQILLLLEWVVTPKMIAKQATEANPILNSVK